MGYGAWGMEHGAWSMEHGAWGMGHGAWGTRPSGILCVHFAHIYYFRKKAYIQKPSSSGFLQKPFFRISRGGGVPALAHT